MDGRRHDSGMYFVFCQTGCLTGSVLQVNLNKTIGRGEKVKGRKVEFDRFWAGKIKKVTQVQMRSRGGNAQVHSASKSKAE
jgi:hypothetical protein